MISKKAVVGLGAVGIIPSTNLMIKAKEKVSRVIPRVEKLSVSTDIIFSEMFPSSENLSLKIPIYSE